MSAILLISIAIRILALGYSLFLLRRIGEWRLGFLAIMLALMASRQLLAVYKGFESWEISLTTDLSEIPGLLVSGMAFLVVHFSYKVLSDARERAGKMSERESSYRLLADNVHDIISTRDLKLKPTYVSPSVLSIRGFTPEEAIALAPKKSGPPGTHEIISGALQDELALEASKQADPNRSRTVIVDLYRKDGSIFPAEIVTSFLRNEKGQPTGILSVTRDITTRQRAEEALRAEQMHARSRLVALKDQQHAIVEIATHETVTAGDSSDALRIMTEIVAKTLGVERVSVWALNEDTTEIACMDLFEKSPEQHSIPDSLASTDFPSYFEALSSDRILDAHDAATDPRTKEFRDSYLVPNHIASMLDAPIRVHGKPYGVVCCEHVGEVRHWEADELSFVAAVADQVSQVILNAERKTVQLHEEELERQLLQSQKMESLGTFAGGIAHDFNNILQVILGFCAIAQQNIAAESEDAHYALLEIEKGGQRAADLIQQILTFSRKAEVNFRPLHLQPLIQEFLLFLRGSLPASITIKSELSPECKPILGDSTQIHQSLSNLCTNAFHAMEENGGVLTISLQNTYIDDELDTQTGKIAPGEYAQIDIRDTGAGIDSQLLDRLLDPFFTTKEVGRGTGLGLAMVHGITRGMSGGILIDSTIGEGTTISLLLPATEIDSTDEPENESVQSPANGSGRILVVDDEPSICKLIVSTLERSGFQARGFTDVDDCLAAASDESDHYDAVVLDYTMPKMNGVELARRLHELRPGPPAILITGVLDDVNFEERNAPSIAKVFKKPFDLTRVATALNRLL